ncbi:hypothetical protein RND71_027379 [Anisodus tanguticus]|uniref:Uncharacterized protein n=1 Tax=Anisodus tanguticus TaxID=243964 RepID=A0AAE1RIT8_9SOLA|nr:hypothetical protein RND71_027379 [Anisodus tanguticus]
MKHLCKSSDKRILEFSEDIIIEILHRLPSKSLARKSSEIVDGSLDESVNFLGRGVYIIASSNGFVLIADDLEDQGVYYVYNPAMRQHLAVPVTQTSCISVATIGFHCKVDDLEKDVISFTIVHFEHSFDLRSSVTIESFSSDTNTWTTIDLVLDVPISVSIFSWAKVASLGAIDGVFCWIDMDSQVILYDSVNRRFWALELTEEIENIYVEALGVSGGALYYAVCEETKITVWCLESNIRSQDAVWVRKLLQGSETSTVSMKRLCKYTDKHVLELSEDIIIEILHVCLQNLWRGRDDGPLEIHFFFSSRKSSEVVDGSIDESVNFVGRGVQHFAVPQASCISVAAIGFHCKVDDPKKDVISFTIVRYEQWFDFRSSVTIGSLSSETNTWTTIDLVLDVPLSISIFSWAKVASLGVIDGVFCWINMDSHVILYDSVNRRFWALELTEEIENKYVEALGISGGALYYAVCEETEITVWRKFLQ